MAATTLKAIIDRFQVICEGGTLSLQKSLTPFTLVREPNATLESAYYLEDGGVVQTDIGTNEIEFRVDAVTVHLARRLKFAGQTEAETLQTTMNTLERLILADGPAQGFHASVAARVAPAPMEDNADVIVAGLTFNCDYDFSTAVV